MSNALKIERRGNCVVVKFTRPEIRNPLSREVVASLHELVDDLSLDTAVRKVIFTGSGDAFASGANLNEIAALSAEDAPEFARFGQTLMQKIDELPQLVIAAINGHCFGGALDLAVACDARIASPNAKFAHPGTGLGIITGWGGTQRLPRLIGHANSFEMFFTASPINAERALNIGLIDEIADDPLALALELSR
jgi:enoyl-CoA hydratase